MSETWDVAKGLLKIAFVLLFGAFFFIVWAWKFAAWIGASGNGSTNLQRKEVTK